MAKEQRRIRAGNMHNGFAFHVDAIPGARSYKNVSSFAASRSSPPLLLIPSQKRGTRTQGCFPVLNNFKSHRPTDSYPLQPLSSSTTTFAAISTRPIPGSRMNFREIPSSPSRNTPYNSLRRNDHSTIRTIAPFFDRTKVFLSSREIADPPPLSGIPRILQGIG